MSSTARADAPALEARPVWRQPDLLKLLIGETISDFGSQVGSLALPLVAVLALDATPGQMAALRASDYLPRILVGLAAGIWVDRLRRRPLLIAINLVRAALLLSLAGAAFGGVLRVEQLYGVEIVLGALAVVFGSAFSAYLPSLVPARSLAVANGARETTSAATEVVGPGLGGVLVQALGAPWAIAVDGVSFIASALGLLAIRAPEPPPPPRAARRRADLELREGLLTLVADPVLRAFLGTMFVAQLFYSAIMAVYLLYLTRELGLSPVELGLIFGLGGGVGVLAGSAVASTVSARLGIGTTLVLSHALFGLLGLPLALATLWPSVATPLVFAGELLQLAVNAVYMVNRAAVQQAVTPHHLRGRVASGQTAAHAASGVLGIALGGVVGETLGLDAAIWVGVVGGMFSFIFLLTSPVWRLRELPSPADNL